MRIRAIMWCLIALLAGLIAECFIAETRAASDRGPPGANGRIVWVEPRPCGMWNQYEVYVVIDGCPDRICMFMEGNHFLIGARVKVDMLTDSECPCSYEYRMYMLP